MRILLIILPFCFLFQPSFSQNKYRRADSLAYTVKAVSLEDLHTQLVAGLETDEEKIRSFYTWIANNIRYDMAAYLKKNNRYTDQIAPMVFKNRKAVCHGYSELFQYLCNRSAIKCHMISGYTKKFDRFVPEGHTWNVVNIEGNWRAVDATWGAGGVNEKNQFVKSFDEKYFLTDPEVFLTDHYPFDPMWQLVTVPVKLSEYKRTGWVYKPIAGKTVFAFNDTIAAWESLDSLERNIRSGQRMFYMNPDDPLVRDEFSIALLDAGDAKLARANELMTQLYPEVANPRAASPRKNMEHKVIEERREAIRNYYLEADRLYKQAQDISNSFKTSADNARRTVQHNYKIFEEVRGR